MTKSRGIRRRRGSGSIAANGRLISSGGVQRYEHVLIAEKVLGRSLPKGAVVHHIDGNNLNNSHNNLRICPNQQYHLLMHKRQRALDAGCPAHWRKCPFCKEYDDPELMNKNGRGYRHISCVQKYNREKKNQNR